MGFTAKAIEALKPAGRPYVKTERGVSSDRRGLQIRVHPGGQRTWLFRYTWNGATRYLNLGTYPDVSLADAHARLAEARGHLQAKRDPKEHMGTATDVYTVAKLAEEWRERYLEAHRKSWRETWRILAADVLPAIGGRPVAAVTPRDLVKHVLDPIVDRGSLVAANRCYSTLAQMFRFAVTRGALDVSPIASLNRPTRDEGSRNRTLTDAELRQFWLKVDEAAMLPHLRIALKLLAVTGQRRGEMALAEWREFDLDAATWTIPVAHQKSGHLRGAQPHVVPLSGFALELVGELQALTGEAGWLFPSPHYDTDEPERPKGPIDPKAITRGISRNRAVFDLPPFTPHDLRRTVRSRLAGLGVDPIVARRVLNHRLDGMDAVYDRHSYDGEKRAALEQWADHLREVIAGKRPKVVALRS